MKKSDIERISSQRKTLLLVEDEEMLLDVLKSLLEENGYKILTAHNGKEAIEIYKQNKDDIALVVSDMGLPVLGGWEAFQKMKEVNPNVKAILASGYVDPQFKAETLKAGAIDYLQKPYDPEEIVRKVSQAITKTKGEV